MRYHGSSASILQFPTADKPGIVRVRSSFSDLSAEDRVLDLTTLDSYTKVPESKLSIKIAPYPKEKTKIPHKLYDDLEDCLSKGIKEELKCTKIVASILPLIDNVSHDVHFQSNESCHILHKLIEPWAAYYWLF